MIPFPIIDEDDLSLGSTAFTKTLSGRILEFGF